jgi:hypothetical protein
MKGTSQNEAGTDGIGDTPQIISSDNTDRYPLITPYVYAPQPNSSQTLFLALIAIAVTVVIVVVLAAFMLYRRHRAPKQS